MLEQRAKEHRELKMKRRQDKLEERRQRHLQREREAGEERKKKEEKKRLHNLSMIISYIQPCLTFVTITIYSTQQYNAVLPNKNNTHV